MADDISSAMLQFARALEELPKQVEQRTQKVTQAGAEKTLELAKANCPVKSGALRDSLKVVPDGQGGFQVTSDLPYAAGVEERDEVHHQNGKAHFLRDAANEALADITEQFEEAIEETLEVVEALVSL